VTVLKSVNLFFLLGLKVRCVSLIDNLALGEKKERERKILFMEAITWANFAGPK
jgi:hypothetical protein